MEKSYFPVETVGYTSFPVKGLSRQIFYERREENSLIYVTSLDRSTVCERFSDHETHPLISTGKLRVKTVIELVK